jgi:hypothetical protein
MNLVVKSIDIFETKYENKVFIVPCTAVLSVKNFHKDRGNEIVDSFSLDLPVTVIKMNLHIRIESDSLSIKLNNPFCPDYYVCHPDWKLSIKYARDLKSDLGLIAQGRIDDIGLLRITKDKNCDLSSV